MKLQTPSIFQDKFLLGIIIATVLVIVVGVFFVSRAPGTPQPVDKQKAAEILTVKSDDWVKGPAEAPITLVEYLDFECEACRAYYPIIKQLKEEYKDKIRFVVRYFPLPGHKNSMTSTLAVEAAGKQGKYWEMLDKLFNEQKNWGEKQAADPKIFEVYAQQIGLNMDQFKKDVVSKESKDRVERDKNSGTRLGVSGTPTFFLNGDKIPNPKTPEDFKTFINAAILKAPKPSGQSTGEKVHEHADFALYVNGKRILLQDSPDYFEKDPDIHSHKGTEEVIHKHKTGVTLGQLIDSWKADFPKEVNWYVNGKKQTGNWRGFEFKDLDRIVMSFSSTAAGISDKQLSEVTDRTCVYSEKCPERGKPPTENCVGGLGTDCL